MAKPKRSKRAKRTMRKWAQKSVKRMQRKGTVGALRRTARVKPGGKIGKARLRQLKRSSNPKTRKRANWALNVNNW